MPLAATLYPTADSTIYAGSSNKNTNYGTATTLSVGTSTTSDHTTTSAALLKFTIPSQTKAIMNVILELTVASVPSASSIMLIIGNVPGQTWNEKNVTWSNALFAINSSQSTTTAITSIAKNLISLDANKYVAGHVSVASTANVGDVRRIDVTKYVTACAGKTATFTIARRMRNNLYTGNSAGNIPADTLSSGATTKFYSKESSYTPALRILYGKDRTSRVEWLAL